MPADDITRRLLEFDQSRDFSTVQQGVRQWADRYGYDRIVLFSAHSGLDGIVERIYWIEGDWFDNGKTVDARDYVRHCPVTRHVLETAKPFYWTKICDGTTDQYHIVKKPSGAGVHGLQIPVFGPLGLEGAISLGGKTIESSPKAALELTLLASAAFSAARRLLDGVQEEQPQTLSRRETQVLSLTALGKRQSDIALSLGLSIRTIENHLRNIRIKLGVATTAEAVRIALQRGYIKG